MKAFLMLLLIAVVFVSEPVFAAAKGHGIVVTDVNVGQRKIVLIVKRSGQSLSYSIPTSAVITIDGESATLDKIRPHMHVITYTESDEHMLSQLDVGSTKVR